MTHAQTPQRPQHKSPSRTASLLHRSGCLTRSDRLQQRLRCLSLLIALTHLPTLIRPYPGLSLSLRRRSTCCLMLAPCCPRCPLAPDWHSTNSSPCPCRASAPAIKTAHAADSVLYICRHCNAPTPTCSPYMVYLHRRSCPRLHRPDTSLASATYWLASGPILAHKTAAHSMSLTGGLPPMPAGNWQACQCLTRMTTPTRGLHRAPAPLPQWVPSLCRGLA